ncbi:MAG: RagB/SusD family nutrient uptake outer membrane protein [Bacteroidota bacterium]
MKKILVFSTILAALSFSSCKKFLDRQPESLAGTSASFYKTAGEAESALTGSYDAMQPDSYYGFDMFVLGDVPSDICFAGGDNPANIQIDQFNVVPGNNGLINRNWNQIYQAIGRTNDVIDHVNAMASNLFAGNRKTRILGEARMLRGLHYFNLVRIYGNIPLVLKQTTGATGADVNIPNSTPDEIYNLGIIPDLEFAVDNLDNDMQQGRVTRGTALGLLSKIYLTRGDWVKAADYAKQVMDLNKYSLLANYDDLWEAENTSESLFEIQFSGTSEGQVLPDVFLPQSYGATYSFIKFNTPTPFIINYFSTGDVRKASSMVFGDELGVTSFVYKYRHAAGFSSAQNILVLRYADILLARAEALNEIAYPNTEALEILNRIRERAGATESGSFKKYKFTDLVSQQQFRDAIAKERVLELSFEGHRWFDLIRTNKALEVMQAMFPNIDEHNLLYPIPQGELDKNPSLEQNLGYQ